MSSANGDVGNNGRPFCRDACFKHANVQPKAVFSNAMTLMDAVYGWEDEEKRAESKFAACGSTPKKCWQEDKYSTQKRRSTWRNEWCSSRHAQTGFVQALSKITNGCQKAQLPSMQMKWWAGNWITILVFRMWYNGACCGFQHLQGWMEHWKTKTKETKRYHEAVNLAITDASSRPFGGELTEIVHVGISGEGPTQNSQKVVSEQGDGRMDDERESWTLTFCWRWWQRWMQWWMTGTIGSHGLFRLRSLSSSCCSSKRRRLSKVKKTTAVLKRAMTEKRERWQGNEWYGRPVYRWQQPTGCDGGQSSTDTWDISQTKGKWREISAEMDAVVTTVKEKTNTWNKSFEESAKRETAWYKMVEVAVINEKQEERERGMTRDLLGELRKRREEEDEARNLIE